MISINLGLVQQKTPMLVNELSAQITGKDKNLISKFSLILRVLASGCELVWLVLYVQCSSRNCDSRLWYNFIFNWAIMWRGLTVKKKNYQITYVNLLGYSPIKILEEPFYWLQKFMYLVSLRKPLFETKIKLIILTRLHCNIYTQKWYSNLTLAYWKRSLWIITIMETVVSSIKNIFLFGIILENIYLNLECLLEKNRFVLEYCLENIFIF